MTSDPGYGFLDRYVRTLPGIERATIFSTLQSIDIYRDGRRIDSMIKRTDGEYWKVLDYEFLEGHPYTQADDDGGRLVAVINEDMRNKLFDGKPAVGQMFDLDGRHFRVVGVVPRTAFTQLIAYSQIWVPIGTMKSSTYRTQMMGPFHGAVVVRDKSDIAALKREFANRLPSVPLENPKEFTTTIAGLDTPFEWMTRLLVGNQAYDEGSPRKFKMILATLAVLFMALPALNLVTLNLSRIGERGSEIGVRRAFGAPRLSLVRQFLFENIVMTVLGGLAGFALAGVMLVMLNRLVPAPDTSFVLSSRVFLWGILFALVFGVLSGVYPAWRMSKLHPVEALRGGAQ